MSTLTDIAAYKSNKNRFIRPYLDRTRQDGGIIYDLAKVQLQRLFDDNAKYGSYLKLCWNSLAGYKPRVSGLYNYATKAYDMAVHQPQYGPELVVNGGFDSDSWWNKLLNTTIADGVCHIINNPANGGVGKTNLLTVGKTYKITVTILNYISGQLFFFDDVGIANNFPRSNGVYEKIVIAAGVNFSLKTSAASTNNLDIDNVSVREVLTNDLTQTTALNQPPLQSIAPTERPYLINPNGGVNYMTHPTISFGAGDAWTVECVMNWHGDLNINTSIFGDVDNFRFGSRISNTNNFILYKSDGGNQGVYNTSKIIAKNSIIHLIYNNSNISIYVNGLLVDSLEDSFSAIISGINRGWFDGTNSSKLYHYTIFSKALSPSEVASRSALLRNMFPEIETVPIGTQQWAIRNYESVCTPQGNLMHEMQAASNVEKITNAADRDFSSDTGFWTKQTGWTISDGVLNANATAYTDTRTNTQIHTINKWYKITLTVTRVSGEVRVSMGGTSYPNISASGTYTFYLYPTSTAILAFIAYGGGGAFIGSIDNVSVQEVGWSGSQELYDGIYANTSGTVEQKTYAAVKAAAMWSHYNNDPQLGVIYGKLYNWFAVKLLQMDLDYYNVANPTTPWGYGVPFDSEFPTDADSLKHIGNSYWTTPNSGTNTTGFTSLPAGYRDDLGVFYALNTHTVYHTQDVPALPTVGGSLRLIKR